MYDFIMQPWPWWFSGVLIGLTVPMLFLLAGRSFGISTSFQQIGAMLPTVGTIFVIEYFIRFKGSLLGSEFATISWVRAFDGKGTHAVNRANDDSLLWRDRWCRVAEG